MTRGRANFLPSHPSQHVCRQPALSASVVTIQEFPEGVTDGGQGHKDKDYSRKFKPLVHSSLPSTFKKASFSLLIEFHLAKAFTTFKLISPAAAQSHNEWLIIFKMLPHP